MTAVKYHGEYPFDQVDGDGKPYIEQHGFIFHPGASVTVTDKALLEKFEGNHFFEVVGKSDKDDVKEGQAEAEKAETENLQAWLKGRQVPFHHKVGLPKLRELKAEYEKAQQAAQKD